MGLRFLTVSTHSRPKAAGCFFCGSCDSSKVSTHSRPKAAGSVFIVNSGIPSMFQHTAARRRLVFNFGIRHIFTRVSTHSRPKAAGFWAARRAQLAASFNTQPPEGGWQWQSYTQKSPRWFQHTAARRRLAPVLSG